MKDKKYTILYFLDYGKSFGGAANTLLQQAILMKKLGHKVSIFFSDYRGTDMETGYSEVCQKMGIQWKWGTYQLSSQPEDIDVICLDRNYDKLKGQVKKCVPDILHSVQINPCVEMISRELGVPHIMNVYPLISEFFSINYIDVFPHYHVCDSWYYANRWKQYLKTDSTCIRTLATGIQKEKKVNGKNILHYICVGTIYPRKNQLAVIKAFHRVIESGVKGKLELYGYAQGEYADACLNYIRNNNLEKWICLKGFCTDMAEVYAKSDVLLCGSTRESYPNVISEAMANDLIVISTPVAGVPEIVKDRINGYLSEDYTEDSICRKILEFNEDYKTGKTEKILENTRETFQKNHTQKAVAEQLQKYYEYVCSDYAKKGREQREKLKGINDIRDIFSTMIQKFACYENSFSEKQNVALKLWYLYYIEPEIQNACKREVEFYIWGTGKYGKVVKEIVEIFLENIHISGFIDSYKDGKFGKYEIYKPDSVLEKKNAVIFLAIANGQNEIIELLNERHMKFNKDFFILAPRKW